MVSKQLACNNLEPSHKNIKDILNGNELRNYVENIPSIKNKIIRKNNIYEENLNKTYECSVCYEENIIIVSSLKCKHKFCKQCTVKITIDNIFKCPLCRAVEPMANPQGNK